MLLRVRDDSCFTVRMVSFTLGAMRLTLLMEAVALDVVFLVHGLAHGPAGLTMGMVRFAVGVMRLTVRFQVVAFQILVLRSLSIGHLSALLRR